MQTDVSNIDFNLLGKKHGKATHSSIPAWRIPWTEEPGGLQSAGSQTAGHDRVTNTLNMYKCKIMYELLILIGN